MLYLNRYVLYSEAHDAFVQHTYNLEGETEWGNIEGAELFDTPKWWMLSSPTQVWLKITLAAEQVEEVFNGS